jgi:hypothetical protein
MVLMQRSSIVGDEAALTCFESVSEGAMDVNHVAFDEIFWANRGERGPGFLVAAEWKRGKRLD